MKWVPSKVGAEPKKLVILGVLVVGGIVTYWNASSPSGDASASVTVKTAPVDPAPVVRSLPTEVAPAIARDTGPMPPKRTSPKGSNSAVRSGQDFRPTMKPPDDFDVSSVDPAIRWDLLAKVREVPEAGGSRSLFEFSKAPEPPPPPVAAIKPTAPPPPPPAPVVPPKVTEIPKPPPPPIPLKYYGFTGKSGDQALFLEGDKETGTPYVASVDGLIKNRYKVIRIGLTSAVLEDTSNKNQQTLPIEKDPLP